MTYWENDLIDVRIDVIRFPIATWWKLSESTSNGRSKEHNSYPGHGWNWWWLGLERFLKYVQNWKKLMQMFSEFDYSLLCFQPELHRVCLFDKK